MLAISPQLNALTKGPLTVAEALATQPATDSKQGLYYRRVAAKKLQYKPGSISAKTLAIATPSTGNTLMLSKIIIQNSSTTASVVNLQSAETGEVILRIECAGQGSGINDNLDVFNEIEVGTNKPLYIDPSAAVAHRIYIQYYTINATTREPV